MPLFSNNSSINIIPVVDQNEETFDVVPKPDGRRRLSLKKSFFTWSSQKQYIDKNKFLFDSYGAIPKKDKKDRSNSFIMKSNKYSTSHSSYSSVNYDESENELSSGSDLNDNNENTSKDYYSMEDLDNITTLKTKPSKIRKVAPLSECTLCYSSNANTINTVSIEFNGKNKLTPNNDVEGENGEEAINYGFEENPMIEALTTEYNENQINENQNEEKVINSTNNNNNDIANFCNDDEENSDAEIDADEEDNNSFKNNDEENDDNDDLFEPTNYSYSRRMSRMSRMSRVSKTSKASKRSISNNPSRKTVTFCDDIVIINPKKEKKSKNIFKRAISKIIKKKEGSSNEII
ncbi:hypothetical protein BCR36DRAFT_579010 [Piromyces finnis]|uniref:Uncharacterized protein n=1 Tax=Piromyces finnis TaxID=1754191 RepID=A0A1Y1VPZ0_9FUNG|nr:hypothetical protein BCR36DRAFT_579010 [Piromyces finnis]|eukprot:ORX60941.1 hypothetical protein BCR36DRAFT_579010 [Piromyces finnis]